MIHSVKSNGIIYTVGEHTKQGVVKHFISYAGTLYAHMEAGGQPVHIDDIIPVRMYTQDELDKAVQEASCPVLDMYGHNG